MLQRLGPATMRVTFEKPDIDLLRKEHMLVDMHFHSKYSHDCSTPVEAILKRVRELGVGVAITDHNRIGGVLAAERIAPGAVRPGIEICTAEGKDILAYFYDVKGLEDFYARVVQPQLRLRASIQSNTTKIPIAELLDELSRENCVIALPHPFALPPRRSYMYFTPASRRPLLSRIHAFEVVNQTMIHKQNLAAIGWAMQFDKAAVGGSDGHTIAPLGSAFTLSRATTWGEFLDDVKAKRTSVVAEERTFRHHMLNATNLLREKARIIRSFNRGKK